MSAPLGRLLASGGKTMHTDSPSLARTLDLLLSSGADAAGFDRALLSPVTRVELARQVYAEAGAEFGDSPHDIAVALRPPVLVSYVPRLATSCGEVVGDNRIVVRDAGTRRTRGLLTFHGLAHVALQRAGLRHVHLDAWLLTFELAAPWREIEALGEEVVVRYAHLPERIARRWIPLATRAWAWREAA